MRPPGDLQAPGRALWRAVTADFVLDPAEAATLVEACRCADELARIRAALVDAALLTVGSAGQPVANPLLSEARAHRTVLGKLLDSLALPRELEQVGRTPASRKAAAAARKRWDTVADMRERKARRGSA